MINQNDVRFRAQNFLVSLKSVYIEANLPKRQVLECASL